jgi:hypothetical protein
MHGAMPDESFPGATVIRRPHAAILLSGAEQA